ncbi:basic proline-rich protein-like [Lathamus discolor]|uniref:basic proline-rich protein-like n=1 Tax=Lathamus discolor TaxID=678569 RepID=UPI0032B7CF38
MGGSACLCPPPPVTEAGSSGAPPGPPPSATQWRSCWSWRLPRPRVRGWRWPGTGAGSTLPRPRGRCGCRRDLLRGGPPRGRARLLEGAAGCRVSLCVRRRAPGTGTAPPGPIPTLPKKPPAAPSLELALPKLPKLGKSRSEAEPVPPGPPAPVPARPRPAPARLTVKEAAGGRAMQEPPVKAELPGGARFPAVEVAVPAFPVTEPQGKAGDGDAFGGFRLPSVSIPAVELVPKAAPEPVLR